MWSSQLRTKEVPGERDWCVGLYDVEVQRRDARSVVFRRSDTELVRLVYLEVLRREVHTTVLR